MTAMLAQQGDAEGAFSLIQALPLEAHAVMGLVLLCGIVLWLFGGRVVKPLFALLGLAVGAVVGLVLLPTFGVAEIAGTPGALIGLGIGAVIGLVLALVLLRVAIVFAAGLAFAAVGLVVASIYVDKNPMPDDAPPPFAVDETPRDGGGRRLFRNPLTGEDMTIDELTRSLREANSLLRGSGGEDGEAAADSERFEAIAVRCRAVCEETYDTLKAHVNAMSVRERVAVFGSTLGGLALGLLAGFVFPKRSTAMVTALAGSGIMLVAGVWLIDALVPSMAGMTDRSPLVWGGIWAFAFLLGLVAQLSGLGGQPPEPAKKKKPAADDDGDGDDEEEEEEE